MIRYIFLFSLLILNWFLYTVEWQLQLECPAIPVLAVEDIRGRNWPCMESSWWCHWSGIPIRFFTYFCFPSRLGTNFLRLSLDLVHHLSSFWIPIVQLFVENHQSLLKFADKHFLDKLYWVIDIPLSPFSLFILSFVLVASVLMFVISNTVCMYIILRHTWALKTVP